jgi:hypothetical protein
VFEPNEIGEALPPLNSPASFFWRRRSEEAKAPHFSSAEAFFAYFFWRKKVGSKHYCTKFQLFEICKWVLLFHRENVYPFKIIIAQNNEP